MKCEHLRQLARRRRVVLGSRSPRRVTILKELGIPFTQMISKLDESLRDGESPYRFAGRLAREKALSLSRQATDCLVLGCDTIVVYENRIWPKPVDPDDAFKILSCLSGRTHVVCTALALTEDQQVLADGYELTEVTFNRVTPKQIRTYIDTGEPMDKAGAYGIQGMGAFLVDSIRGNLDNVIGLPVTLLDRLARQAIVEWKKQ